MAREPAGRGLRYSWCCSRRRLPDRSPAVGKRALIIPGVNLNRAANRPLERHKQVKPKPKRSGRLW